jgi:hypothetical protein
MSANLWMLIILQGSTLTFSPGYHSVSECQAAYQGPNVICSEYDPQGITWTAAFKTPAGGFGSVYRFPNESKCQDYIGALRADVPSACRQMAHPEPSPCPVACRVPEPPPAAKPEPVPQSQSAPAQKLDPLLIRDKDSHEPSFSNRPIAVASVSAPTRPKSVAIRRTRKQPQFDPIGALVAFFTPRD